ncbi:MAG: flagellar hook-length control protein FliK [Moorellaceae bacterium]
MLIRLTLNSLTEASGKISTGENSLAYEGAGKGWRAGQVLEGKVLTQTSNLSYLLLVEGKEVLARSDQPLPLGRSILMEVQGRQGNCYKVRLLPEHSELAGEIGEEPWRTLLYQLGLEDSPVQRALIQGFLAKGLPLTPELFKQANSILAGLGLPGRPGPADLDTALLALKWGIPPVPEVLRALQAFISGEKEWGTGSITRLARFLAFAVNFWEELPAAHSNREEMAPVIETMKSMLSSLVIKPEEDILKLEHQLQLLLSSQLPEELSKDSSKLRQKLPDNELLRALGRLLQEIRKYSDREAGDTVTLKNIVDQGEQLEKQLLGQQIVQLFGKDNNGQELFYFCLPLLKEESVTEWAQLVIKREGKGQRLIDPENFRMTLLLHTQNLGSVLLDIKVGNREVTVRGKVEKEWVSKVITKAWPQLQQAFAELGYRLEAATWELERVPSKLLSVAYDESVAPVKLFSLNEVV